MTTAQCDLIADRLIECGIDETIRQKLRRQLKRAKTNSEQWRNVTDRVKRALGHSRIKADLAQLLSIASYEAAAMNAEAIDSDLEVSGTGRVCFESAFANHNFQFALENKICPRCSSSKVKIETPEWGPKNIVCETCKHTS